MMIANRLLAVGLASLVAATATASASPSMKTILTQVESVVDVSQSAISPDGTHVAWAQTLHHRTALWVEDLATRKTARLTAAYGGAYADESDPQFSPDGSRVAFLSDARSKGTSQIYVAATDGSGVRRIGTLTGAAQGERWSPDDTHIALLYIAHPHRKSGATSAGGRAVGLIGSVNDEQQLATLDVRTGVLKLVTASGDYVYEYGWSPDSKRFAFTYARGNGDNNWWIAKLATIAASGGALHDLLAPSYQINAPTWSPDGKHVAVIGGLMSDFGSVGGDVYLVDVASGKATDVTPNVDYTASAITWLDNARLAVVTHRLGGLQLLDLTVATGQTVTVIGGEESLRSVAFAKNGAMALVRTSFSRAPELWAGKTSALAQITHANAHAPHFYGKATSLRWSSDSYTVQGWLIYPRNYVASKSYPMVVIIHGGPSAASTPYYNDTFVAALAASGYFVLEPNPRGSYGQGEAYTLANRKDFGYGDWRDDLAGVDAAIKAAPIDPNRLGLFGWSYGGYMAMWAETQTTRFKAIVAGAGVANWLSYYGENNINQWMIPFFGASVYDDPAVYAKSSPMTFIKNARTPMLLLSGERDEEVPVPQSFEFYNALQTLGVPAQFMVYADEGHGIRKPKNQVDRLERTIAWFDKYLR
ncbi:MAG TPA: S9 family peptidase [Candidatus Baltobacteraceae bacterium]|nr:S9 family peptidase [Candidatus Baltobacteraceae bacterium]